MNFGVDGVVVRYGRIVALDGVTLHLRPGEVTAIVGGDGSGKSTLLRAIVGLETVAEGVVTRPASQEIGYLPTGGGCWAALSVDENVEFVGGTYGLRGHDLRSRADNLLTRCGLVEARSRLASQLSGGMRSKLGFCLAMLSDPRLLVLDEPTTGVDPVSRVDLWRLISETAATGTTVVMATTYTDEAERAAVVTLLHAGQRLLLGSPDELLASLPGDIVATDHPTTADRAWRHGTGFREWYPDGAPDGAHRVPPDLGDVSVVAELRARESAADAA